MIIWLYLGLITSAVGLVVMAYATGESHIEGRGLSTRWVPNHAKASKARLIGGVITVTGLAMCLLYSAIRE